jgi:hypothetical protein
LLEATASSAQVLIEVENKMARFEHLPIYKDVYVFTREFYRLKLKLPKHLKYDIGSQILESCMKIQKGIIVANGSVRKLPPLRQVALECTSISTFLRLLYEFQGISHGEYRVSTERLVTVQKGLSAWMKWENKNVKNALPPDARL